MTRQFHLLLATGLAGALALTLPVSAQTDATPPAAASDQDDPTQPVPAGPDMQSIVKAYQAGDYVTAREGLALLAPDGDATVKYRYGRILYEGRGGPRDLPEAARWLTEAVADDHSAAATLLAQMYLRGDGVARDPARAVNLLERAATRGDAEAQFLLGVAYRRGTGTAQDAEKAFNWFLAAAEQDHVEAQFALSQSYAQGAGVAQDDDKALGWLEKAAANGLPAAQFLYAANLEQNGGGDGAAPDPKAALMWYRRAAEAGDPDAQRILGTRYLSGDGVDQNGPEALRWLTAAAQSGDAAAMNNLGFAYATGTAVAPDDAMAFEWYQRAADRGLARAISMLATLHETGRGTAPDLREAVALYRRASELGETPAAVRLGQLAAQGRIDDLAAPQHAATWVAAAARAGDAAALTWLEARAAEGIEQASGQLGDIYLGIEGRAEEGVDLLRQAAEAGDTVSQYRLGRLYSEGEVVAQDFVEAHKWFNISATHGLRNAAEKREVLSNLMTPDQIAEAQTRARAFFEADQGPAAETGQPGDASQ